MDAFIAVTGNSETNIMSCLVAKSKGVRKTIALVENMDYFELSHSIGIDTLINKKLLAANTIFRYIRKGEVVAMTRSEEHTSELQSRPHLVCRLLFEKKSWHMLKQRTRLAWKSKWKRLNWDLRAVGVFYVHLVLFAIAVTVLTWIFQWMTDTIFMVFD